MWSIFTCYKYIFNGRDKDTTQLYLQYAFLTPSVQRVWRFAQRNPHMLQTEPNGCFWLTGTQNSSRLAARRRSERNTVTLGSVLNGDSGREIQNTVLQAPPSSPGWRHSERTSERQLGLHEAVEVDLRDELGSLWELTLRGPSRAQWGGKHLSTSKTGAVRIKAMRAPSS